MKGELVNSPESEDITLIMCFSGRSAISFQQKETISREFFCLVRWKCKIFIASVFSPLTKHTCEVGAYSLEHKIF